MSKNGWLAALDTLLIAVSLVAILWVFIHYPLVLLACFAIAVIGFVWWGRKRQRDFQ